MYLRFNPFEGSRLAIVAFDEFIGGLAKLSNTGKVGSSQGLAAQDTETNLNRIPFVVEAKGGPDVQRLSYADWLQQHPGEVFWVGRLKGIPPEKRAKVAEKAAEQIGNPYDFWDFDLEDANGFYCSKLAWLAILQEFNFLRTTTPIRKDCFGFHRSN
jgi:hypothetical protein